MKSSIYSFFGRPFLAIAIICFAGLVCIPAAADSAAHAPETVRILSFNLWHGGDAGQQPIEQTVAVIKQSQADIVGLQETAGLAPEGEPRPDRSAEIAKRLGWHYFDQGGKTGIISRFEIVAATPRKWGAKLVLPSGRQMYAFNVHFPASPYQPYQLLRIPYDGAAFLTTEAEAIRAARDARGRQVEGMLAEAKAILPEGLPVILTGDFNEPSHLDWTEAAVKANLCPLAVQWPSTKAVEAAGFVDAYRNVHLDPVKWRGLTWTPVTKISDPEDRHDRIDFVFVGGADRSKIKVNAAHIVGESREFADIVVSPYPSDHRAVVVEVEFVADGPTR